MLEQIQSFNAGVALILVLIVLINPKGYNKRGNLFLGLFMLSIFIQMIDEVLRLQGLYEIYPNLGSISISFLLSMPVFLFLGILFYVKPNRKFEWRDIKYFAVLAIFQIAAIIHSILKGNLSFYNRDVQSGIVADFYTIILFMFIIQLPYFWFKGHRLLQKHKTNSTEYSAANEEVSLDWLIKFNYLYLFMILMFVMTIFLLTNWMLLIANITFLIGLLLMAINTLKQKEVFPVDNKENNEIQLYLEQREEPEPVVVDEPLSDVLIQQKDTLLEFMITEKPYLDNEINLSKLSSYLETSTHQLSATLNTAVGMNFSNFINSYRIKEAQSILLDLKKQHYTMVQVAYEAGYNSKTVFNTHFKKTIGISPTVYKKEKLQAITA